MFAASLHTLKKRTTQLLKGEDGKRREEGPEGCGTTLSDLPENLSLAAPEGHIVVCYEVQNDAEVDRECAAFLLPLPTTDDGVVTLGHVRTHFPVPGQFHFRFKAPTGDGSFGGFVWVDLANDQELAPVFRGEILLKVLRLPGGVVARRHTAVPTAAPTAAVKPVGAAPPPPADDLEGAALAAASAALPGRGPAPGGRPTGVESASPSPPVPPPLPSDLMEVGTVSTGSPTASSPVSSPGGATGRSSPPPPPVVMPNREQLIAEREAKEKARVDEARRMHETRQNSENQMKQDKLKMSNKLYTEMDQWAKTTDGQSFKDIRTLLSTMHTVLWPNSGWNQLPLSELVAKEGNVRKYYRKAVLVCHPDRQQESDPETQVRADRIFNALNEAFKATES